MLPRDDPRHQDDMDWLYGSERPNPDKTAILDATEQAELERRRAQAAGTGAQAAQEAQQAQAQPQRVVHREDEVLAAAPPRTTTPANPTPATPTARPTAPTPGRTTPARTTTPPPAPPTPPSRGRGLRAAAGSPKRRRPHWLRWLAIALVAWLVWLVVVPLVAVARSPKVSEQPSGDRPAAQPGTTTLLVGSDGRSTLSAAEQKKLGTGGSSITGERTDTMMLLYSPPSGRPVLVSLPRDSYVSIPGHGHNKLNAAYSLGGPQLLVRTIEQDTGLRIDNYMEIGFDGFANIVDAVGGVKMCLPAAIVDKDSHTNLPAGCQTLNGTQALGYVRMRKADPTGDIGRMKRQRATISAIVSKATSPWTFINPVRYWRLNMASGQAITRGQDTGLTDLAGAAWSFAKISRGQGLTLAVPVSSTDTTTAAGSSVIWDQTKAADMFGQMARGDTSGLDAYAK